MLYTCKTVNDVTGILSELGISLLFKKDLMFTENATEAEKRRKSFGHHPRSGLFTINDFYQIQVNDLAASDL